MEEDKSKKKKWLLLRLLDRDLLNFLEGKERKKMSADLQLPPGFRFHPTDEELVMHYLCRKCATQSISVPIIAEIDLYKYDPWDLPGNFSQLCVKKK